MTAVAHSRSVQLSTAVMFLFGLPVLSKPQPEGGPTTTHLAKRLECCSAVSSRLCDSAHSQAEQVDGQNFCLTVGKCLCSVDINFSDIIVNRINQTTCFDQQWYHLGHVISYEV